jgi:mRNA-degrading endonuclease RelE of RelBE toxin-antitoxin system
MSYSIKLSKEAESDIDYLYHSDKRLFHRILKKIEALQNNPFEGKPLIGNHKGGFSFRSGNYRIVYSQHTPKKLSISLP